MSSQLLGADHNAKVCAFFDDPTQLRLKNLERALVLGHVFVVIGNRHPGFLERVPDKVRNEISLISQAFIEVQVNFFSGINQYTPLRFPKTREVMSLYCPIRMDSDRFFQQFSELSFRILPSEQYAFGIPFFDSKLLESIRKTRQIAAVLFLQMTDTLEGNEEKKMGGVEVKKVRQQSIALTSHLFCVGAFYHPGTQNSVKFIDLFDAWVFHSLKDRESVRKRVSERVVVALPDIDVNRVDKLYLQHVGGTFREFLTNSTLENIQQCLDFVLSEEALKVLAKWCNSECFRIDIAFFVSHPRELCSLKLSEYFDHNTTFKLQTFQLFFLIVKYEGVASEKKGRLLEMLICRRAHYRDIDLYYEELDGPASSEESIQFTSAWSFFERMIAICDYAKDKAWFLFYFFLRNDRAFIDRVVNLFEKLSKSYEVKPSFEMILSFCDENPAMNLASSQYLLEAHRDCRKVFEHVPDVLPHLRQLFIKPPICLAKNYAFLMWVEKKAKFFKEETAEFNLEINTRYFECLQLFLLRKIQGVLVLLRDRQRVGVKIVTTDLLHAYFHSTQTSYDGPLKESSRVVCSRMVCRFPGFDELTDLQRVSLYRDLMTLHVGGKHHLLREVYQLISEMQELCSFVPMDIICWFYRFHPPGLLEKIREIQAYKRDQFLKGDLGKVVLNPDLLRGAFELIRQFTDMAISECSVEKERKKMDVSINSVVLPAFIPPMGPLVSYFHIDSRLDSKGLVQWELDPRLDSLGQYRPVVPGSSKAIYLDWSVVGECPCLFLSFFDGRTKEAVSTYVCLELPLDELKEERRRKGFLSFLYKMAQYVLREETEQDLAKNWDENQVVFQDSVRCFLGAKEILKDAAEDESLTGLIDTGLDFLERVKIAYRLLNLGMCSFDLSCSVLQVAARGDISDVDSRQSLLPKAWLLHQPEAKPYLSNVSKDQTEVLRRMFGEKTMFSKKLTNTIAISVDGKVEEISVFYLVDERVNKNESSSGPGSLEMEEKALLLPDKYVTISCTFMEEVIRSVMLYEGHVFKNPDLFWERCSNHFLMLKAKVYRHALETKRVEV